MDAAKREELERRRAQLKAWQENADHRKVDGDVVPRLRSGGIPHRMLRRGEVPRWLPHHLPTTWSRIFWEGAPAPAERDHCGNLDERVAAVGRMLRERTAPTDDLLFVYDSPGDPVMIQQQHALAALSILLEPAWPIWITSPPNDWLIEANDVTARLALPPPVSPEEAERAEARRAALLAPLAHALDAEGVAYRTFLQTDLTAPEIPDSIARAGGVNWQRLRITSRAVVARGDSMALRQELRAFLSESCDEEALLALMLLHNDAPLITLEARDLLRFIGPAMAAADRWDENAPGGEIYLTGLRFYPVQGEWLAEIYAERANWRMRAAGCDH